MNYLSLRRSNSISSSNDAGVNPALRSIYSNTNSGHRALVFTVEVPERGPLGLDLRARHVANPEAQTGAIVKGFRPVKGGKRGFIELTGRVKEKDILMQMHNSRVDDMLFDAIVELATSLQTDLSAWPLRLEFRREAEEAEVKPKAQTFTSFLRSTSMSLAGFASTPAATAPSVSTIGAAPEKAQDGTFQDKLNYFRGFFKDRLPTATESKKPKIAIPDLPSEELVNEMYRDLLVKRNVPDDVLDELVRIEQLEQKWHIVWSAKQNENDDNHVYIADAIKLAESLVELNWDNRGLAVLETLQRKIASGTPEWTDQFIVSYGLDYLAMKMPEPSPFSIEHYYKTFDKASRFCEVILRILLSLSHFSSGIDAITHTLGLVDKLALCFHTDNADVKKITLQVLGIICYNSAEGHAAVVHSFSHYMEAKGERVRFTCLRDALKSTRYNLLFKEDVLSFINILVNKGLRVESRVAIRQDFMMLGIGDYFEEIRNKSIAMYNQAAKIKRKADKPAKKPKTSPTKPATAAAAMLPMSRQRSSTLPVATIAESLVPKPFNADTTKSTTGTSAATPNVAVPEGPLIDLPDIPKVVVTPSPETPSPTLVPLVAPPSPPRNSPTLTSTSAPTSPARLSALDRVVEDDWGSDLSSDDEDVSPLQQQLRDQLDNVEKQIEVFELFWEDDRTQTLYGSTDLSSMESVMDSLKARVKVDEYLRDCLLSILQQLLFIPSETVLGKEMWGMAERVTKEIALLSPVEEVRAYELSFQDRKTLMQVRDKFTSYISEHEPDLQVSGLAIGPIALMGNPTNQDEMTDTDDSDEDQPSEQEDDEVMQRLEKFRKLSKMGMPLEQVHMKMRMENLDVAWLESYTPPPRGKKPRDMVLAKDHDDYRKYFKLLSMGMPLEQAQMKMGADNPALDVELLKTPEKKIPLHEDVAAIEEPPSGGVRAQDCPALLKFFKLKKMGMPEAQIQMKMQAEGFDGELLVNPDTLVDDDGKKFVAPAPAEPAGMRADECPALAKFFKLKKIGMPETQIQLKMQAEGFESEFLLAPETLVDEGGKKYVAPVAIPTGVRADACPALAKFFKLKKMGMPEAQIQMKMQAEGFDGELLVAPETLVDDDGKKFVPPAVGMRADECPALTKFFKLKKMGMPEAQIQMKMQAEGFDGAFLTAPETLVGEDGKKFEDKPKGMRADECPALTKFFKLQKMGMPFPQIQLKMQAEGFDAELLNAPETLVNDEGKKATSGAPAMVVAKEHPSYAKFFKLMKMGMPLEQIKLKASSEGLNPAILDTPDAMLPEVLAGAADADAKNAKPTLVKVSDHPSYAKYFKLQKMGMPLPQIQLKMNAEGLNPDLLESPDKEIPEKAEEPAGPVLVKDHPQYSKYLKLQTMGMPPPQIEMKMKAEGLNYALLATPDAEVVEKKEQGSGTGGPTMGAALNAMKFVAKLKAKPKLRNLYWEPVKQEEQTTTLWADIDPTEAPENKLLDQLVTLFASAPPPSKEKTAKKPGMKKKAATRIGLIDVKRANNIGIMLARFRMPYPEIKRAILEVDRDILSSEKVAALIQFAPEGEEMATVKGYSGDVKMLGDAEQYFVEIASVPRFQTRLQAVLATMQFDSNVEEQRRLITSVASTCKELKRCDAIPQILKLVLQLGNALNEGTARGSASGFKLSILLKLVQVKAADNSMTLLNYLAIILREKEPDWLNFIEALPSIQEASRVTHQVLKAGEAAIRKAADLVVQELDTHKNLASVPENDKFQEAVGPFADKAKETSDAVLKEFQDMLSDFGECVKWFGEDPEAAGMGPDTFFSIFVSFAQMLQAADRDNERKRIAEERRVRREEETKKRMATLASSKSKAVDINSLKAGDAQAIVKKIRGKRAEEKRKELVEQGFETTNTDSFSSNTSMDKKKGPPPSSGKSDVVIPPIAEENPVEVC
ncbi:Aste57867_737 [Aphanomyces stellatus]|uniref:Aste57867_737 protein n=1 Tax=Aphanomyces stellatus TaxID=120398 RepID=A0A485K4D8_9STRA|nr:hypothetical protein As57867_000736 [Aphanomyces stellatus]VFT77961.1 Aste57867_737 [Aphanomyces stellatus]